MIQRVAMILKEMYVTGTMLAKLDLVLGSRDL